MLLLLVIVMSILLASIFTEKDYKLVTRYKKVFMEGEFKKHLDSFYNKKIDIFDLVSKFSYCENYEEFIYDFLHSNLLNALVSTFRIHVLSERLCRKGVAKEQSIMSIDFCIFCTQGDLNFIVNRFLRYFFLLFRTMFLMFSIVIIINMF